MKLERYSDCPYVSKCTAPPIECEKCTQRKAMLFQLKESNLPEYRWKPLTLYPTPDDKPIFETLMSFKADIEDIVDNRESIYLMNPVSSKICSDWAVKLFLRYLDRTEFIAWKMDISTGKYLYLPQYFRDTKNFDNKKDIASNIDEYELVVLDGLDYSLNMTQYDMTTLRILFDKRRG